jgi:diguanylate cyclase (GGDEF)-like protein/PAS domain S-box-containing protein
MFGLFLFVVSLLAPVDSYANIADIQFKNLTTADGLSSDSITDIAEDGDGYIWIATFDGLNRYDGYTFKQYKHESNKPNSLPEQLIRQLLVDNTGTLWVVTHNGIGRYNPNKDNFDIYNTNNSGFNSNKIDALTQMSDGSLLAAGEQGLYQLSPNTEQFEQIHTQITLFPPDIIFVFSEENRIWLGTYGNGIYQLNRATGKLSALESEGPIYTAKGNLADYLHDIKKYDGHYWLATEKGILVLDENNNVKKHYNVTSEVPIVGNWVRTIEIENESTLWIGTELGISILNTEQKSVISIDKELSFQTSLSQAFIGKIFKDSNHTFWVGTYNSGVNRYNERDSNIKHFKPNQGYEFGLSGKMVWAIAQGSQKVMWIATQNGGVSRYSTDTGKLQRFLDDQSYNIWDLDVDDKGHVWIATSNGVHKYVFENNTFSLLNNYFSEKEFDIIVVNENIAWLSSNSTVLTGINTGTGELIEIPTANNEVRAIRPLYVDSNKELWLSTNLGLSKFNLETKQFNQLIINLGDKSASFNAVAETDNAFWASTYEQGLLKLSKPNLNIEEHFSVQNQLSSNRLIDVLAKNENVWAIGHKSIQQIDAVSNKSLREISESLLNYNNLNEGAAIAIDDGTIFVGGNNGFHEINSNIYQTKQAALIPSPELTELKIFNKIVSVDGVESPLDKPINRTTELRLSNDSSPFTLEFASINSLEQNAVSYRYKLIGSDENWLETNGGLRQATYTNLDFGNYEFQVQARSYDGLWSPSRRLSITIEPPFWLDNQALALYVFAVLLFTSYWFKQYRAKRLARKLLQDSEERLKLTLWSSGDELWDWDILSQEVHRSNTWGTMDFPQDDIRAFSSYERNVHPEDIEKLSTALNQHLSGIVDNYSASYRVKNFKDEWIWVLDRGRVVSWDDESKPLRMTGTLKNIDSQKLSEEQLHLFRKSIETISDGVFITDSQFRFVSVNESYCRHTGNTREQALASYLRFYQYPEAFTEEVKKTLINKGNWFGEIESTRVNGERFEISLNIDAIKSEDGVITNFVGVLSDITARKTTEKELLKLANTDPLTNLPNRSFFQASHDNLVRKNTSHALLCLDIDNFKKINDSLGHQTGDLLIKQIATRLQKLTGNNATCYRLGGDEFSILIDKTTDVHRITHFAQFILDEVSRPFIANKQEFVLGASLGLAFFPGDGTTPQELLKNADTAMYFAKNSGGHRYQFFSGEMNQHAVRQLQIENLIRHGLKEDLFTVYYQPKVDVITGKLVSMEALVRFEHPEKGIVSPNQFIPLAEQTGQIIQIGETVLRKACADTQRWVKAGLFTGRVAVNISARQFELPDLDDRITKILKQTGLSPLHLECEITEGTLMQQPEESLMLMERLRERGIHLALDDFGTGYSSLAYLKQFPLNTLKIDKAFIDDIAFSSVDRHMMSAIITIAHNLGLKVVAEGVEQEEQLSILRNYECEMIQGYLFSKPLRADRFESILKENKNLSQIIDINH